MKEICVWYDSEADIPIQKSPVKAEQDSLSFMLKSSKLLKESFEIYEKIHYYNFQDTTKRRINNKRLS